MSRLDSETSTGLLDLARLVLLAGTVVALVALALSPNFQLASRPGTYPPMPPAWVALALACLAVVSALLKLGSGWHQFLGTLVFWLIPTFLVLRDDSVTIALALFALGLVSATLDALSRARPRWNLALVGTLWVVLAIPGSIFLVVAAPPPLRSTLTHCQSNLRNLGSALEMYSVDNAGHYPSELEKLIPNDLKSVPTCGSPSVSSLYRRIYRLETGQYGYQVSASPDFYTLWCRSGLHHLVGIPVGFPQYNSLEGPVQAR